MTRFLYGDLLWKAIGGRAKKAHRTKAAIAYVTRSLPLLLTCGDILVVDATDRAIGSRQTSATVLEGLLKKGVQLFSHEGLHAKFIIMDAVLYTSSANLSESSVTKLLEAGIETDNPNAVSGAVGLIEKLIETSIPMDRKFIARIKRMVVVKQFVGAGSKAKFTPNNHREPVTWLLGVHDINDPKNPDELKRIESGSAKAKLFLENPKSSLSWIRYGRKAKAAEARRGDNLIIISRDAQKANAQWVYPHAPVLRVQNEPNCIRLFYEQVPSAKKKSLSWIEFKKLAKQAGLHGEISKNTTRQLTDGVSANLHDYWEQVQRK